MPVHARLHRADPIDPPAAARRVPGDGPLVQLAAALNARPQNQALRRWSDRLAPVQRQENRTGMPDGLKAGVEALSGRSFDAVRVHYNSGRPARFAADAVAQGHDIHLAPGQERHLPHEAWHVAQQMQGRVPVTAGIGGVAVNDDPGLEAEADRMGRQALDQRGGDTTTGPSPPPATTPAQMKNGKKVAKTNKAKRERRQQLAEDTALRHAVIDARNEEDPTRTGTFHEFGDDHRDAQVDPDVTGVDQGGIFDEGHRPDDAPTIEEFRIAFNRLQSSIIYLEHASPDRFAKVEKSARLDRRFEILAEIKAETKRYKDGFRDLRNTDIDRLRDEFTDFVREQARLIREMTTLVNVAIDQDRGRRVDRDTIHAEGTEAWRARWHVSVQEVNALLQRLWPAYEARTAAWIERQPFIRDKDTTLHLDYIGSLAKGYKGPPKQHVRFEPADFDVDANLEAPALAEYLTRAGHRPDRERVFARHTDITPLIEFADKVQSELVKRIGGIQEDPHDIFDVAIHVPAARDQRENERQLGELYAVRERQMNTHAASYTRRIDNLHQAGLLTVAEDGGSRLDEDRSEGQRRQVWREALY